MKTITIRNIPNELREKLVKEAKRNRRSLNQEVLVWLETAAGMREKTPIDMETELREIRALRVGIQPINPTEIDLTKREGRF